MREKENDYEKAAEYYQKVKYTLLRTSKAYSIFPLQAWKLAFEASAPTGFKLAYCLLKCRRCVECLDICEKVL